MSSPGITAHLTPKTALNQEGKALPGLAEVQPLRCLCLVGQAAPLVCSRRGWVLGEHSLGGEVGVINPPKQRSQMWGQCVGWGCSGWTPDLGSGRHSPPYRDTCRAGRPCGMGCGGTPAPGLGSWVPSMLHREPLRTHGAADATSYLLTVIKSLANGFGRKNSHDEDLSWAPIPDLSNEDTCSRPPPSSGAGSRSFCRGAEWCGGRPVGSWGAGGEV